MKKDKRGLAALRLHLPEPEAHVHLAVHRPCGGEVLAVLEPSQAAVAVSREGAHAEVIRQGQRPEVVGFGTAAAGESPRAAILPRHRQGPSSNPPLPPLAAPPPPIGPVSDPHRLANLVRPRAPLDPNP